MRQIWGLLVIIAVLLSALVYQQRFDIETATSGVFVAHKFSGKVEWCKHDMGCIQVYPPKRKPSVD